MKYKLTKGIKKALLAAGAVAVGMAGGVQFLDDLTDPGTVTAIAGVGAVVAGARMGWNWWKVNKALADKVYKR